MHDFFAGNLGENLGKFIKGPRLIGNKVIRFVFMPFLCKNRCGSQSKFIACY